MVQKCDISAFKRTRQVKSNRCLRPQFITVNQNTLCRFVCVCRTDMRVRAFESPDPGLCFKYHIMGVKCLENFLRARKGRGFTLFQPGQLSRAKSENFSKSKKLNFGGQNDLKFFFFFSKCF